MKAAISNFCRQNSYILPFAILFITSLFMHAAGHRVVFYVLAPFMGWMLYQGRGELRALIKTKSFVLLAAYLGYFSLTFFWSDSRDWESFFKILRDVAGIMLFSLTLAFVIPKINIPRLPVYFAGLCVAFGIFSAIAFYGLGHVALWERLEGLGRYENAIHFAFLMSFGILALVCSGFEGKRKDILIRFGLILALLLFVSLSQTRSAYICLLACLALLGCLGQGRTAIFLGVLLVAVTAICLLLLGATTSNLIVLRLSMDSYRLGIWAEAWEAIKAHFWLGNGIETAPRFSEDLIYSNGGWKSTHNVYIGHMFTGGIIGFLIFAAMIWNMTTTAISTWWRERKEGRIQYITALSSLLLCFALVSGVFLFTHYIENVHIHWLVFWVVYAMLWSMEVKKNQAMANA